MDFEREKNRKIQEMKKSRKRLIFKSETYQLLEEETAFF